MTFRHNALALRNSIALGFLLALAITTPGSAAPNAILGSVRSLTKTTDVKTPQDVDDINFVAVSVYDGTPSETVRGLTFLTDGQGNEPGNAVGAGPTIQISSNQRIANWGAGNTAITGPDAAAMNAVVTDIRYSNGGTLTTTLSNLTVGERYRLQMISYEAFGTINRERIWDIIWDDGGANILAVDDFDSGGVLDPTQRSGAIWEYVFTASNDSVVVGFPQGTANVSGVDESPILQAVILSQLIPEPTSVALWSLIGLGLIGFGYFRARRTK